MLIPPTSSAAQAASVVSQATAKDSSSEAARAATSATSKQSSVEQANAASPDRDAQGQGDGLPSDARPAIVDELEMADPEADEAIEATEQAHVPAAALPGETPSQLDISG